MCRLGYSKKGWITGEVTSQYIPIFAEKTKPATPGAPRLLIVDGHISHYSRGFLEGAREHNIHVICYPSHTTHVYQALDVGLFGPLKAAYVQERDRYEREKHEPASKKNFLTIFGRAVVRALTKTNIEAAMARAGTWPINESVVTPSMLAPSLESSWRAAMPLPQPSPVRVIARLLELNVSPAEPEDSPPTTPTRQNIRQSVTQASRAEVGTCVGAAESVRRQSVRTAIAPHANQQPQSTHLRATNERQTSQSLGSICEEPVGRRDGSPPRSGAHATVPATPRTSLRTTSMAHLVNSAPITSQMAAPLPVPSLQPAWTVPEELLARQPTTEAERAMLAALQMAKEVMKRDRASAVSSQATMVLQNTYVCRVKGQLAAAEEKRKGGRTKARLLVDGMPRVLTSDAFVRQVDAHNAAVEAEEEEKRSRGNARASWQAAVKEWELHDAARRSRNEQIITEHSLAVIEWEIERDRAKSARQKPRKNKPVRGPLEAATPRPLLKDFRPTSIDVPEDFSEVLEAIESEDEEEDEEDRD